MGSVDPEQWYAVKEVGAHLGVSRDTVIRQIDDGFLEAFVKPGRSKLRKRVYRSRRIQGAEVLRYLRENTRRKEQ